MKCLTALCCISGLLALAPAASASTTIEKVAYDGWNNCIRMSNGKVELVITTDVGPRIIRFAFVGGDNVFSEDQNDIGKVGGNTWHGFGGHRLWLAPEANPRSYHPDNTPVKYRIHGDTVTLTPDLETTTGFQKQIDVTLDPDSNHVKVVHKITNHTPMIVETASWAITVCRGDGESILPQEDYQPHPGIPDFPGQRLDQRYFAPVRGLSLWSFTKLGDPRWVFTNKYIVLRGDQTVKGPEKIGIDDHKGWAAYARKGTLFVKRSAYRNGATYPDRGCNFETFTVSNIVELESLGPVAKLGPNESTSHTEDWYLFDDVRFENTDASIDKNVMPRVKATGK
jgi:hypothetical protein